MASESQAEFDTDAFLGVQRVLHSLTVAKHVDILKFCDDPVDDNVYTAHLETSVADGLSDKAHNYLAQNLPDDVCPNSTIAISRHGEQRYFMFIGPESELPPLSYVYTRPPVCSELEI